MPFSVHELDVELGGSSPRITRRLEVPSSMNLAELHEVLQIAMGWQNAHLFIFLDADRNKLSPGVDLDKALPVQDSSITYIYDFGDHWSHRITARALFEQSKPRLVPLCTGATRACPPEDIGGIARYQQLLAFPMELRREEGTLPADFSPRRTDKDQINQRLTEVFSPSDGDSQKP